MFPGAVVSPLIETMADPAIRIVSLHQVDTVLHRTHIGGVRVGTLTELVLLVVASVATFWVPVGRRSTPDVPANDASEVLEW